MADKRILSAPGAPLFGNLKPEYTAALRALLWAVISAVIVAVIGFVNNGGLPPDWAWAAPILMLVLRSVEGLVDRHGGVSS